MTTTNDRAGQPDVAGLVTRLAELLDARETQCDMDVTEPRGMRPMIGCSNGFTGVGFSHRTDAEYVVAAWNAIPALLAAITELQERVRVAEAEVVATEHRLAWAKDALLYIAAIAAKDRPVPRPDIIECAHREADAIPLRLLNDDGSLRYGNRPEDE